MRDCDPGKLGHIVVDTLLPTQMFPRLPGRTTFVADTNFGTQKMCLILFRSIFLSTTNVSKFAQLKKHHGQQCVLVYQGLWRYPFFLSTGALNRVNNLQSSSQVIMTMQYGVMQEISNRAWLPYKTKACLSSFFGLFTLETWQNALISVGTLRNWNTFEKSYFRIQLSVMFILNRDVYTVCGVIIAADIKKNDLEFTSCLDIISSW